MYYAYLLTITPRPRNHDRVVCLPVISYYKKPFYSILRSVKIHVIVFRFFLLLMFVARTPHNLLVIR